MNPVFARTLPTDSIALHYQEAGSYVDSFSIDVNDSITFEQFVNAFYTSRVFKLERVILAIAVRKPSTDQQARLLAAGEIHEFSAWDEEARTANQLIMRDYQSITRSWLMTEATQDGSRLYFGSIIVPRDKGEDRQGVLSPFFRLTLGAHLFYSRVLLRSAVARLHSQGALPAD